MKALLLIFLLILSSAVDARHRDRDYRHGYRYDGYHHNYYRYRGDGFYFEINTGPRYRHPYGYYYDRPYYLYDRYGNRILVYPR